MQDLLSKLSSIPLFKPNKRFIAGHKCAVVGSSNTLLGSGYGSEIDGHDVVIRCNQAFTTGFEDDVGTKFTARFINGHNFCATDKSWPSRNLIQSKHPTFDPDFLLNVRSEIIISKDHDTVVTHTPHLIRHLEKNQNTVYLIHPEFKKLCGTISGRDPTTGFIAAIACLKLFGNVSCYGFKMGPDGYHHYYEKITPYNQDIHDFNVEYNTMQNLGLTMR